MARLGFAVFEPGHGERHDGDAGGDGGSILTFEMEQQFPDAKHLLGRFRLSVTASPRPIGGQRLPENIAKLTAVAADKRSAAQKAELTAYFESTDSELKRLREAVARSAELQKNKRLIGVQDIAWALINNPAFLFNR